MTSCNPVVYSMETEFFQVDKMRTYHEEIVKSWKSFNNSMERNSILLSLHDPWDTNLASIPPAE